MSKYKCRDRTSKEVFNKAEVTNIKWRVSIGSDKKTLKKKIVAARSKFIKYNRKHSRV